jgi:hypothetical protein
VCREVQSRAERPTAGDHLFTAAECVFGVLRLDQDVSSSSSAGSRRSAPITGCS